MQQRETSRCVPLRCHCVSCPHPPPSQVTIFRASLDFLSGVLETRQSSLALLGNLTYSLLPELTVNLNEAAADSVNQ